MNKVVLIGTLVKDVELRYTKKSVPVASYTIAINTKYGEKQETDYINITTWGRSAEFVSKYFGKGQPIAITGRLKNKNYESNGVKHYSMEVVTEEIDFVGSRKEQPKKEYIPTYDINDDDIPF